MSVLNVSNLSSRDKDTNSSKIPQKVTSQFTQWWKQMLVPHGSHYSTEGIRVICNFKCVQSSLDRTQCKRGTLQAVMISALPTEPPSRNNPNNTMHKQAWLGLHDYSSCPRPFFSCIRVKLLSVHSTRPTIFPVWSHWKFLSCIITTRDRCWNLAQRRLTNSDKKRT